MSYLTCCSRTLPAVCRTLPAVCRPYLLYALPAVCRTLPVMPYPELHTENVASVGKMGFFKSLSELGEGGGGGKAP